MKIVVLDSLLKQTENSNTPTNVIPKILGEIQRLAELERLGRNSVDQYLQNHHGIKMKGGEKIRKYELTDGDRILYASSDDLPWLSNRIESSYVLLRFSKHDDQGSAARKFDLSRERGYTYIKEIVEKMSDLEIDAVNDTEISMEDYVALAEILNTDYSLWHTVYVVEDKDYRNLSLDEMNFMLSSEQHQHIIDFLAKPRPTLIIGGAGTGKTLIAVHLLIDYVKENRQKKTCYFTQSPELRRKVKELFAYYGHDVTDESVAFEDINEFCVSRLGLKHSQTVYTREFLSFIENNPVILEKCQDNGITPIVVWTEIRGLIKGGMSRDWSRTGPMPQNRFTGSIQSLVKRGYFTRDSADKKKIILTEGVTEAKKRLAHDGELSPTEKKNVQLAIEYFSRFDPDIRMMPEREYLEISDERSSVERDTRSLVWDICRQYDDYLVGNGLYDENDLIRMMFGKGLDAFPKYNLTVIDEVQDYSELQLFFIKALTEGNKIVFAGDEHQNINPASFSESRLKSLFFNEKRQKLTVKRLRMNFRCQEEIIKSTNALAEIRRSTIGSGSAENEEPEVAQRQYDALPIRLACSDVNVASCVCELMRYPKAVILVPDTRTKERVRKIIEQSKDDIISSIGEEKYDARMGNAVFTVAEIKGVEYEYVLCYDLIGTYINVWQTILAGVHQQTKYRFYFNLLYVAMTRAQNYLCFVDSWLSEELDKWMGFRPIDSFDADQLYLSRLGMSEKDWYDQAVNLEKNGKYWEALKMYEAAKAEPKCFHRCNYYIAIEEKEFDRAVVYAILLDAPEMISEYLSDVESPELEFLARAYIRLKNEPEKYDFRKANLSRLIQTCIPEDMQPAVTGIILGTLRTATQQLASQIIGLND